MYTVYDRICTIHSRKKCWWCLQCYNPPEFNNGGEFNMKTVLKQIGKAAAYFATYLATSNLITLIIGLFSFL